MPSLLKVGNKTNSCAEFPLERSPLISKSPGISSPKRTPKPKTPKQKPEQIRKCGVFWKKLELTSSIIRIYDFRPLLPRQSAIDFQNGKFFFPLKKTGGEILKKTEEKFSFLSSDEIGGGSKKRKGWKIGKLPLPQTHPCAGNALLPMLTIVCRIKVSNYV